MRKHLLLFFYLCFSQNSQIFCENKTEVQTTFELLERGRKQIKFPDENDVVVVFGATGSGKSTFIEWITGDNKNLISEEIRSGSYEYLIREANDRISSSTVSKTLFPELVVEHSTGAQFYDFPGFSDTRSSSHDIAASFFIKSVMDRVENVKILLMTSYHTVQEGVDRAAFPKLLKNVNDMIGDVDKFNNSIALVVSKVNNDYIRQGRTQILKPDSSVIAGIANFLLAVKKDYEADLTRSDIRKQRLSTNALKIIKILLTQKNGEYTRIILFRRPDEDGPLSEIALLKEGKVVAQQVISRELHFTKTDPNDFGVTISDESKLEINSLVSAINDQVTDSVAAIAEKIKENLKSFIEPVHKKIETKNIESLSSTEAKEFSLPSLIM